MEQALILGVTLRISAEKSLQIQKGHRKEKESEKERRKEAEPESEPEISFFLSSWCFFECMMSF